MSKLHGHPSTWPNSSLRRIIDILAASVILALMLVPVLFVAMIIWIDSPGNPLFFQERVGKRGRLFHLVKLRGMFVDAKVRYPELYKIKTSSDSTSLDFHFHRRHDPRVTRVGKFIRKTSIDELPNVINVLWGDLALVGPRPQIPEIFDLYGIYKEAYIAVRPGITCLAKCVRRDSLTEAAILTTDLEYMCRASFLGDWKILFRTLIAVVTCRDVY